MPQMLPMYWLVLFIYFSMILYCMICFFSFFFIPKKESVSPSYKMKALKNWL